MQEKIIKCPICKERVAVYDGRTTSDIIARCGKCRKRIIYRIQTGRTEIKNIPPRATSSGMRFI